MARKKVESSLFIHIFLPCYSIGYGNSLQSPYRCYYYLILSSIRIYLFLFLLTKKVRKGFKIFSNLVRHFQPHTYDHWNSWHQLCSVLICTRSPHLQKICPILVVKLSWFNKFLIINNIFYTIIVNCISLRNDPKTQWFYRQLHPKLDRREML
jgi:hypothetical protein